MLAGSSTLSILLELEAEEVPAIMSLWYSPLTVDCPTRSNLMLSAWNPELSDACMILHDLQTGRTRTNSHIDVESPAGCDDEEMSDGDPAASADDTDSDQQVLWHLPELLRHFDMQNLSCIIWDTALKKNLLDHSAEDLQLPCFVSTYLRGCCISKTRQKLQLASHDIKQTSHARDDNAPGCRFTRSLNPTSFSDQEWCAALLDRHDVVCSIFIVQSTTHKPNCNSGRATWYLLSPSVLCAPDPALQIAFMS